MIEAIEGKGQHRARVTCDDCGREDVVSCKYIRAAGGAFAPDHGQVLKKMTSQKWDVRRGHLSCPTCAAKRRAQDHQQKSEESVTVTKPKSQPATVAETPEMTGPQKRAIVSKLERVWSNAAGRYLDDWTDKGVAADMGSGIRAGWVADVREEMFGTIGTNDEIEAVREDIKALEAFVSAETAAINKRLAVICAAVGPRAKAGA